MFGAPSRFARPQAQYRDLDVTTRVEAASPHGLISILFEELLKGLDVLVAAHRSGDTSRQAATQARAVSILHGLESGLDHERGGEIANSLGRIYREARRLIAIHGADRGAALDQARTMIADIAGAWASIG